MSDLEPTQVAHKVQTVVRTVFQLVVGVAAFIVAVSAGLPATGAVGTLVAVSVALTAFMGRKDVNDLLNRYVPWLGAGDS